MKEKKRKSVIGRVFKAIGICLLVIVLAFGGLLGYLSVTEYKPADREVITVANVSENTLSEGAALKVMIWNIGYGALGDNADFFMDGGTSVKTADKARVLYNIAGITAEIQAVAPDILMLQETDRDSARSEHIDEAALLQDKLPGYSTAFANNFKVSFLPYPVPPIGKVDSGLASFSAYSVNSAERIQLPIPFAWPMRMANLKRCLLIDRIPLENSDKELVLVNLHLEAYDDGEGKTKQTAMLKDILNEELEKGNYIIAGGDFNQIFSNADTAAFPAQEGKWQAGEIDADVFTSDGWQLLMDASVPSCRSLDQPYEGADKDSFQYYLIDGFIVSPNVTVNSFATQDLGFVYTDHNPVVMEIALG